METNTVKPQIEDVVEELAAIEHQRWAHWQRHMHALCEQTDDGRLIIPANFVKRWERQIAKPYEDLSDKEKESDREQVRKYLPVIVRMMGD